MTPQIGAPHVQVHAAERARNDVLERGMSDGFAVETPCQHIGTKLINWVAIIDCKSKCIRAADGTRSIASPMCSASALVACVK